MGKLRRHLPAFQLSFDPLQRRTDDFFKRAVVAPQFDTGFEARHFEQIGHQPAEPLRFVADAFEQPLADLRPQPLALRA